MGYEKDGRVERTTGMGRGRRLLQALAGATLCCGAAACGTPMRSTTLAPAVTATSPGFAASVTEVHVSNDVRRVDFSEDSRVLVVIDLRSEGGAEIDLRSARLALVDASGGEQWQPALASGLGDAPGLLRDGEHAPAVALTRGESVRAWIAFGNYGERAAREIPERVVLEMPGGERVVLSEPGKPPVWRGEAVTSSYGFGLWLQGSQDEHATNLLFNESHFALDPLMVGYALGVGLRTPQFSSRDQQEHLCCNLAFGATLAWPVVRSRSLLLSPFVGGEAAVLASDEDDVNRRNWFGPEIGLELSGPPLSPRHGPFPISAPRSLLGGFNARVALVHWFGRDRPFPSFGGSLVLSAALGR